MLTGNRNRVLLLTVLPAAAGPGVLLFFAVGQVSMVPSPPSFSAGHTGR
jgi:hypothetical protein